MVVVTTSHGSPCTRKTLTNWSCLMHLFDISIWSSTELMWETSSLSKIARPFCHARLHMSRSYLRNTHEQQRMTVSVKTNCIDQPLQSHQSYSSTMQHGIFCFWATFTITVQLRMSKLVSKRLSPTYCNFQLLSLIKSMVAAVRLAATTINSQNAILAIDTIPSCTSNQPRHCYDQLARWPTYSDTRMYEFGR